MESFRLKRLTEKDEISTLLGQNFKGLINEWLNVVVLKKEPFHHSG